MPVRTDITSCFLLEGHQGSAAAEGWKIQQAENLQADATGLRLAPLPAPPMPLKDSRGTFGGLEYPTGVAVAPDETIYVSDSDRHCIFKIVRREGLWMAAYFFSVAEGAYANDQFVYVPVANRLERWPGKLGREPQSLSEIEIICETVWNEARAHKLILSYIKTGKTASTEETDCQCREAKPPQQKEEKEKQEAQIREWKGDYPAHLPAGDICKTSIQYLPCAGGQGNAPRRFNEPRGLAISAKGNLYVADSRNHRIQVFSLWGFNLKAIWGKRAGAADIQAPESPEECRPPEEEQIRLGQPIAGEGPGEFNTPWDVTVDNKGNVYVADKGNHRVQKFDCRTGKFAVFDGTTLAARFFRVLYGPDAGERFVFIPARQRLERWSAHLGGDPQNISEVEIISEDVSHTSAARRLILQAINAEGAADILLEWDAAYPAALAAYPQPESPFDSPTHLAVDSSGRLFVVDREKDYVKFLNSSGHLLGSVMYRKEVPGVFKPSAVLVDAEGHLLLAGESGIHQFHFKEECGLYSGCHAALGSSDKNKGHNECTGMAADSGGRVFAAGGEAGSLTEIAAAPGFHKTGSYLSQPLDSDIERCQWHKIHLKFGEEIPLGGSVTVWTYTSEIERSAGEILALKAEDWHTGQANAGDFLVLSPPGRFLWIKIDFRAGGSNTPHIQHLKVFFPRITYLQYLPAAYQADPVSKDFTERFLSIFEAVFSGIEKQIENMNSYFDPDGVPDDFLPWLAAWVDMAFDAGLRLPVAVRRRLLRNAPELYRKRGTPAGLQKMLWLALDVQVQILEHFQLRRWLFLNARSTLGDRSQLWGNCIVSRLQLEENSRIGEFGLVGTGDPVRDPFHVYAHKFSVFVPAALCRSELEERQLRHLIDSEKPAQTNYTLYKVEARFRVGMQATIGLDTMVGAYPRLILNHYATLGYDSLLSGAAEERRPPATRVGKHARVGVSAVVG